MATHWTYASEVLPASADLAQGDIVGITPELREILGRFHTYFCDPKYVGFLVLTQSCDLVVRKESCAARHITCAPIRSLNEVVKEILASACAPECPAHQIYDASKKGDASRFLDRLFNQNEWKQGLFYLHDDADVQIAEPAVAMLRITISLKRDHYDILCRARTGRLSPDFTAKLGWTVGHLYARVGTRDWGDDPMSAKKMKTMTKAILSSEPPGEGPIWLRPSLLKTLRDTYGDLAAVPREDLLAEITKLSNQNDRAPIALRATEILRDVLPNADPGVSEQFRKRLTNDGQFGDALKAYANDRRTS